MDILEALRAGRGRRIAFIGAGGKTTSMFALARLLPRPVLVTTTTHIAKSQITLADRHIIEDDFLDSLPTQEEILLVTGPAAGNRLGAPAAATLGRLGALAERQGYPLLIEADGARMLPLKAPGSHEPVVPDFCDLVVVCAGLSGLGKPLSPSTVHRPEVFSQLSGLTMGAEIDRASLVSVLTHTDGGLKGIPARAARVAMLNQADSEVLQARAGSMAPSLLAYYEAVLTATMENGRVYAAHQRVAGVLLAAGGSTRLGRPKQLLPWRGKTLVRWAAEAALKSGLSPLVVVTGAAGDQVENALAGLPVVILPNPDWQSGQSTSVRRGLSALPSETGAAVFLLADQPFISASLVRQLVEKHAQTLSPIVAPLVDGQRGNPVLFDRKTFGAFHSLEGDVGARPLFSRYKAAWVPWHDPRSNLDIDTQEDYEALLSQE